MRFCVLSRWPSGREPASDCAAHMRLALLQEEIIILIKHRHTHSSGAPDDLITVSRSATSPAIVLSILSFGNSHNRRTHFYFWLSRPFWFVFGRWGWSLGWLRVQRVELPCCRDLMPRDQGAAKLRLAVSCGRHETGDPIYGH